MGKTLKLKRKIAKIGSSLIWLFYHRPSWMVKLTMHPSKWCRHDSYYPEFKQKSFFRIYLDQMIQIIKYGYPNEFYFSYGFDVKTSNEMEEYMHYRPFMELRNNANISQHGSTAVLRNKFLFGMFCEYLGIDSGNNVGLLDNGTIYLPKSKRTVSITEFCENNNGDFFIKLIDGECGCGIFTLSINNKKIKINGEMSTIDDIIKLTSGGLFIIQQKVTQHPLMASLHPQSLNTMRLVTIRDKETREINVFPSILRIGTGNSFVDNTSQGGVAVGIDFETGKLKSNGFLKPKFGGRITKHPDSFIQFDEFKVPFLDEAIHQALFLHTKLPDIQSIGWDIAIGPDGPIFIEGNDNWEINGPQICNGGLKNLFLKYQN